MSQIWIYSHDLKSKHIIESDVKIKTYDCITPQKTTFEIVKTDDIAANDIILIKDDKLFIGVIDEITQKETTEISLYPLEHIFDNELEIGKLTGDTDIVTYLQTQIINNFVSTDDPLMNLPFVFENTLTKNVAYKTIIDSNNLLDIINDVYLNTGVYLDYAPVYTNGLLTNIKIVFKNVAENDVRYIRYDNPQIVDKVSYEFSNNSTNKTTISYGDKKYKIYLREDNNITTNPNDEFRIKKVVNKNIEFTASEDLKENGVINLDKVAEAIIVMAQKELQGDVFGYQIMFTMLVNKNREWNYRQSCIFTSENKTFHSLVTRLEYLTEKTIRITLGAYRTKLHEKIQKLIKQPKEVGASLGGIQVTNAFLQDLYWFEQDADGNLYICSDTISSDALSSKFELDADKNLYVNYADNQRQNLSIDDNGNLQGDY